MKKVLIVEDDPVIQQGILFALEDEEFEITTTNDGLEGYNKALEIIPDLILLDVMLPNKNGFEICRDLRQNKLKSMILMLTSRGEETDKIIGFEYGADDYLTKPFSITELRMRVKALLRRFKDIENIQNTQTNNSQDLLSFKIDFESQEIIKNGKIYNISGKEFQIIKYFIENSNKVISRDQLLDKVWGYENYPSTRTVDNFILSLRKKIEDDPSNPKHIITVPTVGYKFIK